MKNNINNVIDGIVAYAVDNLMLDSLDEVHARNRLSQLFGVAPQKGEQVESYADVEELKKAIAEVSTDISLDDVMDIIMPPSHQIDYWFTDEAQRSTQKAFEFLYDILACGGCVGSASSVESNGYCFVPAFNSVSTRSVMLDVNGATPYTPEQVSNHIATIVKYDLFAADAVSSMNAYCTNYDGVIAKRFGEQSSYACCADAAILHAGVKRVVKDEIVKIELLDYPVPAIAISGIAKNSVEREVAQIVKNANDANIGCTLACAKTNDGNKFYIVFSGDIASDEVCTPHAVLGGIGVCTTIALEPILSVLEKGTALSVDLSAFKQIYSQIGGVKHGDKALSSLADALADSYKKTLSASATATEERVIEIIG